MRLIQGVLVFAAQDTGDTNRLKDALEVVQLPILIIGGILSAAYSYTLVKNAKVGRENQVAQTEKTRLETEKLRRELGTSSEDDPESRMLSAKREVADRSPARKLVRSPTVESILLRFVALELFARLWFAVAAPAADATDQFFPFQRLVRLDTLATMVFWVFAAPLAFSIFADLNTALGIRIGDLSLWNKSGDPKARRRALYFVGAIAFVIVAPVALIAILYAVLG